MVLPQREAPVVPMVVARFLSSPTALVAGSSQSLTHWPDGTFRERSATFSWSLERFTRQHIAMALITPERFTSWPSRAVSGHTLRFTFLPAAATVFTRSAIW